MATRGHLARFHLCPFLRAFCRISCLLACQPAGLLPLCQYLVFPNPLRPWVGGAAVLLIMFTSDNAFDGCWLIARV